MNDGIEATRLEVSRPPTGPRIDLEAARSALNERHARLLHEAWRLTGDERALGEARDLEGGPGTDSADVASDVAEEEVVEALERNVRRQLFDVERALHRLDSGRYGLCEECGQPIDPARLTALPSARNCLDCQRRIETHAPASR
jgi:DnaK suppressor protein